MGRIALRNRLILLEMTLLMLMTSVPLGAKDLGIFYGEPMPAYAMYAAQVNFAAVACADSQLVNQSKSLSTFIKHFNNRSEFSRYRKMDPEFDASVARLDRVYASGWLNATSEQKEIFCGGLQKDATAYEAMSWRQRSYLTVFRTQFSPVSEVSRERQRRIVGGLSLVGAVASTAASVTAANDSLSSAKAGDWATSNQQMATSREIQQVGFALTTAGRSAIPSPFPAVLDLPDGAVVSCPVTDHFSRYDAPPEDPIWTTYQQVAVLCRDPAITPPIKPEDQ